MGLMIVHVEVQSRKLAKPEVVCFSGAVRHIKVVRSPQGSVCVVHCRVPHAPPDVGVTSNSRMSCSVLPTRMKFRRDVTDDKANTGRRLTPNVVVYLITSHNSSF